MPERDPAVGLTWGRTFAGLVAALFATFTAFGATVPMIPRLVTEEFGGPPFAVGAAFTATAVVTLILRPYGGQLAQRFGGRRLMMAGSALAALVGTMYMLPWGLPGLFATRLVMGVAEALLFTAGSVWTVQLAPEHRRGQVVGWYGLAMWSGFMAGPALGEAVYRLGSYPFVWALAVALPLVAVAVLGLLPPAAPLPVVSRRLIPRASLLPGLALGTGAFGYGVLVGFGALALSARDIPHGPVLLSVFSAAYIATRLVAGWLPDRLGPMPVIVMSSVLEALGLLTIGFAPSWWVAACGAVVAGAGFTLLYPALAMITISRAAEAERGAALGALSSLYDIFFGLAGLVGGAVADVSYPGAFAVAGAVALAALALGPLATRRPRVKASRPPAWG
ncbi:MFS transporter [Nonomuraea sp. NPDC049480]|uniref:MFS transporter n=1 Tax=Nonomuraea sp. NPDC049480 TaxID=3364353 RepID=UPI00379119E3